MGYYLQQESDFVKRTILILKQYDAMKLAELDLPKDDKREKFEITLLINCFVGLLILPQQNWIDYLPKEITSAKEWGIDTKYIALIKERVKIKVRVKGSKKYELLDQPKSIKNVVTHLRNSVSHYHFTVFENSQNEISGIKFKDYDIDKRKYPNSANLTFDADIPVFALKKFLDKFSNHMLGVMEES